MSLVIDSATIIDGVADNPLVGHAIWIDAGRIKAIGPLAELNVPDGVKVIDARSTYAIPGLINANVHLYSDLAFENVVRNEGRFEEFIAEAAQVALKGGLTTVFDTWGPRKPLMAVRDRINAGSLPGSRIFCAGNIVGLDGLFSLDFLSNTLGVVSSGLAQRINALWVENVGPDLSWMPPEQVANEVRTYIDKGIDFIKYASSEHRAQEHEASAFLLFSERAQAAIVEEAHRAGLTAQAHTSAVEALRVAVEAGCDLVQHCNITGPVPIPESTLELMAKKKTGAVVFPFTERRLEWMKGIKQWERRYFSTVDANCRNLMVSGAPILMANDGYILRPGDPVFKNSWADAGEDHLSDLGEGHFVWLKAMEEKGFPPMEALRAATRNIAVAYGKDKDLGTLEPGKIADVILLDRDPLKSAENYRRIHMVLKDGEVVDRESLPLNPILTRPAAPLEDATASYGRFAISKYPCC